MPVDLITAPTEQELFNVFRRAMEDVGFTHWSEGSRIGAIGRTVAAITSDIYGQQVSSTDQYNVGTARGIYLDRIGNDHGVRRLPSRAASTVGQGPTVKFTNNGASSTTIAAGTRVWNSSQPQVGWTTTTALSLSAAAEGYVDVVAINAGELYNVGVGQINAHNAAGQASVTNVRPIDGGVGQESDESYRYRIVQSWSSRNGGTEAAIRMELLKVPGVREVILQSGVRGNGTVDVRIVPIDRYLSQDVRSACEYVISTIIAAGISWRVLAPQNRRVGVTVQLRLLGGTTIVDVRAAVDAAIRGYLDNLRVDDGTGGSELIYNELISRIQDASPAVLDSRVTLDVDGDTTVQGNVMTRPGERLISGGISIN